MPCQGVREKFQKKKGKNSKAKNFTLPQGKINRDLEEITSKKMTDSCAKGSTDGQTGNLLEDPI